MTNPTNSSKHAAYSKFYDFSLPTKSRSAKWLIQREFSTDPCLYASSGKAFSALSREDCHRERSIGPASSQKLAPQAIPNSSRRNSAVRAEFGTSSAPGHEGRDSRGRSAIKYLIWSRSGDSKGIFLSEGRLLRLETLPEHPEV